MPNDKAQPPAWADIANSDQFQTLARDRQERARQLYFQEVVLPQVPPGQEQRARELFDQDTISAVRPLEPENASESKASERPGVLGTLKEGVKSTGRALASAADSYSPGDGQRVVDRARAQQVAPKAEKLDKFYSDVESGRGENDGLGDALRNVGGAVVRNPGGAGLALLEQLPNAAPALGGGWLGMKAGAAGGAALGSVVPGVGTAVGGIAGGVLGGLAGMFLGNAAIETGHKAMEMANDGDFTPEEASQARSEGAIKGGVITGVDAITLGAGRLVSSGLQRTVTSAMEGATRRTLVDRGIDIADEAAVARAVASPEIATAVRTAQLAAIKATDSLRKRVGEGATLLAMESAGEGVGEYLGELAATGEADITDAVLESVLSLGQSGIETAWNVRGARARNQVQPLPTEENPNPAPVDRPDPAAGALSRAAAQLPSPEPVLGLPEQEPPMKGGAGMDQQAPTAPPKQQEAAPKAMPEERSPQERAQYSWDSMNTFERNKAAQDTLGYADADMTEAAAKAWDQLAAQDQQKLVDAMDQDSGQRWDVPNQKISDKDRPVLQNRDRSTDASIAQMQDIKNNPDYDRLSVSRDFGNGAPVVEPGADFPATQLGRLERTTTSTGRKIPVQYAVVEADQLLPSNDALGNSIPEYANGVEGKSRAIAGNGRVAGITAAWKSSNPVKAEAYKKQMIEDTQHGIDPEVIRAMKQPVLVRIMPLEEVSNNIGDESNVSGQAGLSPTEQANTDMRRIDLAELRLTEDNELSENTVLDFIKGMPRSELGTLITKSGRPTPAAYARAEAALFQQAYQNEALTENLVDLKGDAKFIMNALMRAAPAMAKLEGAGIYDIRPLVSEAAEVAVNARRQGIRLSEFVKMGDFGRNPQVMPILEMMIESGQRTTAIGDKLINLAQMAYTEANKAGQDMFGEVDKQSPEALMKKAFDGEKASAQEVDGTSETLGDAGRSRPDASNAEGRAADGERQPDSGAVQADQPAKPETAEARLKKKAAEKKASTEPTTEKWRKNYLLAKKRATELGIDPKEHGKLPGLVKAIDAAIAEKARPEAPALDLTQQTEESLAKDAERLEQLQKEEATQKAKQKAAENKQRERDADKARADEVVDDFQLGQSAEEVMSGMGDIFATESRPADKGIAAQGNDSHVTVVDDQYNPNPTEAQKQAGNYKKAHVKLHGLDITIENPVGSERSGVDPDGNTWSNTIKHDYGYIKRTTGADGDHVDVFIGKDTDSDKVFVIDQPHKNGKFDEHKVMLGFKGRAQAVAAYKANYQKGWKVGPITEMTVGEFKQWLSNGDTTKPVETVAKPAAEQAKPSAQLYKANKKDGATGVKADAITDALASTPELAGVKVVQSFDDLPARVRKQAEIDGVNPGDISGIYFNGTSYVVADNHSTVAEAVRTAVHEEVGHRGIRGLLGDKLAPTMERIYSSMAATAAGRKLIKDMRADYGHLRDKDQRQAVAEELVAHLLETGDKPTLVQRFVSKVRELLRAMFPQVKWTNLDVLALGEQSRAWLRQGAQAAQNKDAGTLYSLKGKKNKHTSESFNDLTDKQKAALNKIAPLTTQQKAAEWFRDKTDRALLKIRQGLVDRFAALRELDEAAHGEDILNTDITNSSWVLARMSSAASGALHAMLNNGRIYLDQKQKVIDIQDGDSLGLGATLARLGSPAEIERFMGWIAGNRSARLAAEGRENLFSADDIDALKTLNEGKTESGKARKALYDDVFKEFQQYRDDVLAIAEQTGIITAENRAMWRDEFYVPFYRVMDEDAKAAGPGGKKGLTRQEAYKKLKGGKQNLNDLLQNTMLNFNHLLTASLKNQAAAQALSNAEKIGVAEKTTEAARDKKASTFVLVDGKQQWYNIDDPLVFEALSMISDGGLNTAAVKVMSAFKRVFTNMTTITPQFIIANLLRDSMQATATSPVSKNFLKNIVTGGKDWTDGKKRARMMATGGAFSFGHIYNNDPHEMKAHLTRNLKSAQLLSSTKLIPTALRAGWDAWNATANAAENANRAAIFSQNEKSKGKLAAAFEARDLMDFSMHGAWPAVRFLIRVIPFLNARLQGLDKLHRSGVKPTLLTAFGKGNASDKQAMKRFLTVVGAISSASMALMLVNNDDEEYRKLEEWQKDTYWFVRVGDKAFFIPKPFEVGVIATMAERLLQQGIDDKATGELFKQRLGHALTETFAFSVVPHALQPILDVYSNVDAFTDRPIESMGMERLSKGLRSRANTTAPAHALSAASRVLGDDFPLAVSPVQADHLIAGYLGQVGAWGAGLVDTMWRTAKGETQPARHWHEYQPIRRFYKDLGTPNAYTRYSTLFYEGLRESGKVYADVMELQRRGKEDQMRETINKNRDILRMRKNLNRAQRDLSKINTRIGMIRIGPLDADEKRREIDRLTVIKNRITEAAGKQVEAMKAAR